MMRMLRALGVVAATAAGLAPLTVEAAKPGLYLGYDGLVLARANAAGRTVDFGVAETKLRGVAAAVWGTPAAAGTMAECGAGPIDFARFPNGVGLHFQNGVFVGWATGEAGAATPDGIGVGSTIAELKASTGTLEAMESTLGYEFAHDNFFGVASADAPDATIDALWGGTSCNFR